MMEPSHSLRQESAELARRRLCRLARPRHHLFRVKGQHGPVRLFDVARPMRCERIPGKEGEG